MQPKRLRYCWRHYHGECVVATRQSCQHFWDSPWLSKWMWIAIWRHTQSSPSYRAYTLGKAALSSCVLLRVLSFLERHEIKITLMMHHFDTSCRNRAMKFLWRVSKCTYPRIFLMSLLCSVTSDRLVVFQDFADHWRLYSCGVVSGQPGLHPPTTAITWALGVYKI